jgi:lipid A ethanolaminephosphotransferase
MIVLIYAKVSSNTSSSKGVANRVTYQDFKTSGNNPICDVECRDVGM